MERTYRGGLEGMRRDRTDGGGVEKDGCTRDCGGGGGEVS